MVPMIYRVNGRKPQPVAEEYANPFVKGSIYEMFV